MARKQIVRWHPESANVTSVWSSPADGALRVLLRNSAGGFHWRCLGSTNIVDRLLPIAAMATVALSGVIIGWVLF
jgi:hypothetical protein